jgi:hydrogenase nickel incorporation protein HypA/HybF
MPEAETRLAGTVFEINVEPARFGCRACGTQFADDPAARDSNAGEAVHFIPELAHAYLRCPECDGPDFEIIEGRGVTIRSIEGSVPEGEA